ncbi:MAG TPA: endopeptidase La [Thermomicrobiales bacterium]|jgi:ATP-dependent Lon protease|nr:endopeptidase La [Thermomicrobiales bacterium]
MTRYEPYRTRYPLLPLKNIVIFPRNIVTLLVGRPRSIQAVEEALNRDRRVVVVAHRDPDIDDPLASDVYNVGTLAEVVKSERQQATTLQVVLEGICRVRLTSFDTSRPFFNVAAEELTEIEPPVEESRTLMKHVTELACTYSESRNKLTNEVLDMVQRASDPGHLADLLATQLLSDTAKRQELLEEVKPYERLVRVAGLIQSDLDIAALEQRIKDRVRDQVEKNQREYYLREQLKAIHDELGGDGGSEMDNLRRKIAESGMPDEVAEKLSRELLRLERMPAVSAEATVVRTYIDTMISLPWTNQSEDRLDLEIAEQILDEDHYGLEHVKERILDFLAVRKLRQASNQVGLGVSQILCLAGPPGVGKTSLGRSIARSMNREFVRVSLGGVRDEAEIRGHRRTYIGAMPGRMITAMKQAGTINPVILLDEIDKLSSDYRGDPASALLEVLDPEQNRNFVDHFLDVQYDLSNVLFITTANYLGQIPRPLRDRMEIIEIGGYTEDEKAEIGRRYLLTRNMTAHGLPEGSLEIPHKVWVDLVRDYTREAGVRELDRSVATLCRKTAREVVRGKSGKVRITKTRLEELMGPKQYGMEVTTEGSQVGTAMGLGTTEIGGELIPVEVLTMPGKGGLTITGRAGEVMQESAQAALSYARSRTHHLRIDPDFRERLDLHIHLPETAQPKDGPSAGITMATALISALTKRPVRADTAMTGEITLRGRVLPIGGLKDKTLAAHRCGIRRLIAPAQNRRDFEKVPTNVAKEMTFIWVRDMDEVIQAAIMLDVDQVGNLSTAGDEIPADAIAPATGFGTQVVTDAAPNQIKG